MVNLRGESGAHEAPYVDLLIKGYPNAGGGINGAHEVPFVALLMRVSKRRWDAGGGITGGWHYSGAFRNSVRTLEAKLS